MNRSCLVLALCTLTSCSFLMTRGPSDTGKPPRAYPSCTTSMTWPIVDGVFAALFTSALIGAIAEDDTSSTNLDDSEASKSEKITSAALFVALTGVSAFVGYKRVSSCRDAHESFQAAYPNGMPYAPYPYTYQQPAYPQPDYPQPQPQPQPTAAPAPAVAPTPAPTPVQTGLGTEGDVCTSNNDCATGLTCASSVCVRPPAKP